MTDFRISVVLIGVKKMIDDDDDDDNDDDDGGGGEEEILHHLNRVPFCSVSVRQAVTHNRAEGLYADRIDHVHVQLKSFSPSPAQ